MYFGCVVNFSNYTYYFCIVLKDFILDGPKYNFGPSKIF